MQNLRQRQSEKVSTSKSGASYGRRRVAEGDGLAPEAG